MVSSSIPEGWGNVSLSRVKIGPTPELASALAYIGTSSQYNLSGFFEKGVAYGAIIFVEQSRRSSRNICDLVIVGNTDA